MELRAQPQASVGHKDLGRASKLFLTLYILVKTCADFFSVVVGSLTWWLFEKCNMEVGFTLFQKPDRVYYFSLVIPRVDWPITNCLPMIKHLFISSPYVLHFDSLKKVMGVLLEALEIIFEVQRKMSNEKITREISSPT
jgi:hypothetical protein